MNNPAIAVIISDIHFTLSTLNEASTALRTAIMEAEEFYVPLIIAGDTLDSKAIIRGEIANELVELLSLARERLPKTYMLVGNHEKINERGDAHVLNFLKPYVTVVDYPVYDADLDLHLAPYYNDVDALRQLLKTFSTGSVVIMHQGLENSNMGHYVQDRTALKREDVKGLRVISGHYHRAQDIDNFSFIGNPYSLSFSEAEDGPKGIVHLYRSGVIGRKPLRGIRKHVILDGTIVSVTSNLRQVHMVPTSEFQKDDILWFKLRGSADELRCFGKSDVVKFVGHNNFKFEKILIKPVNQVLELKTEKMTDGEVLDLVIDNSVKDEKHNQYLKDLWRLIEIYEDKK